MVDLSKNVVSKLLWAKPAQEGITTEEYEALMVRGFNVMGEASLSLTPEQEDRIGRDPNGRYVVAQMILEFTPVTVVIHAARQAVEVGGCRDTVQAMLNIIRPGIDLDKVCPREGEPIATINKKELADQRLWMMPGVVKNSIEQ